jgi:hypothetical protein
VRKLFFSSWKIQKKTVNIEFRHFLEGEFSTGKTLGALQANVWAIAGGRPRWKWRNAMSDTTKSFLPWYFLSFGCLGAALFCVQRIPGVAAGGGRVTPR